MGSVATLPLEDKQDAPVQGPMLTPLQLPEGYVPGKYASFDVSPEPMFGPDELGQYKSAIDDLSETCNRVDSSARMWEVIQAWEARWMSRNYQFLNAGLKGLSMYGAGSVSPGSIMQTQNAMKLFSVNVYGAREDKIVAALSRDVPGLTFVPKRDKDPMDQTAADEAKKYLKCWQVDAGIKEVVGQIATIFYNEDRAVLYTRSVADEQRWGTETPDEQQETFGDAEEEGISPETEMVDTPVTSDAPAVREITTAYGKLEAKVPITADTIHQMPWLRVANEQNVNTLKERYPWIEDKISAGGCVGGNDQLDRMARICVRLAVQTSGGSSDSWQQEATETLTWYRPSQYRVIKDKAVRKLFYDTFPDGLLVVHAGGELAFIRNESMNAHLEVLHPKHGSGQNRRPIGANYLPLQKILNANISLLDRYFRAAVPRRFAAEGPLDVQAINGQANDPAKLTPVKLDQGQKISDLTGIESVPQPTTGIFEFVQWLISGAPEVMDGASPAMWGMEDADTFGATKLNRDQALQVFSMPWSQMCTGLAMAAQQAVQCAAKNRVASIRSNVPGQGRLTVELSNLQGDALCYPESMEIPQTIAEQEAQMAQLLENSKNVAIYQAITNDPRNLTMFSKFPSLAGLDIPGLDAVEQQEGEFELLLKSGPVDNPQAAMLTQQITEGATHPEAQTPEGQQAMQQAIQTLQQLPPKVTSVPVAQDGSENHAIHAAITLGMMNSPEGRKLKNGTSEQKAIYQNLFLHWQAHEQMKAKLTPPQPMEFKGSVTIDPSKYSPEAQAKMLQAAGLEVSPQELENAGSMLPHEITTEREGVDEHGVPVKQKISVSNPEAKLS